MRNDTVMYPSVGFVILTWNSMNVIDKCIQSILRMKRIVSRIIVVDNASADDTLAVIEKYISSEQNTGNSTCSVIKLQKNLGTTVSRNVGINYLLKEYPDITYMCILDSDTEINEESMLKMIDVLSADPNCGIIGPRMHDLQMKYQTSGRSIPTFSEKFLKVLPIKKLAEIGERMQGIIPAEGSGSVSVGYLMSACWFMRTEVMQHIGLLDEKIFYAPEDVDYCIRCWKAGYSVKYCYDADILHHWQRLSRKKLLSKHNYEHIKGLIYLFIKHRYLFNNNFNTL